MQTAPPGALARQASLELGEQVDGLLAAHQPAEERGGRPVRDPWELAVVVLDLRQQTVQAHLLTSRAQS